jgi:isoleucyl-tRNA synthetase
LTFWNTYAFFVTYANLDDFRPPPELHHRGPDVASLAPIDRWLVARTQQLVGQCRRGLDGLDLPAATAALDAFADDLSNWYVRSTRARFWGNADSEDRRAAYQTLWYGMVTAVRCLAPIMPFVADELWANLVAGVVPEAARSVHLDGYPTVLAGWEDGDLLEAMEDVRRVAELGRAARSDANLRRRQPLAAMTVAHADGRRRQRLDPLVDLVAAECNVKGVHLRAEPGGMATNEVVPDFQRLGPKFRADAPRIAALLRDGRFTRHGPTYRVGDWEVDATDVSVRSRAKPGFAVAEGDGWVVALDTALTPELELEGRARDLVREIQELRKQLDLPIDARIDVIHPESERGVMEAFGAWIAAQTLASSATPGRALQISPVDGAGLGPTTQPRRSPPA